MFRIDFQIDNSKFLKIKTLLLVNEKKFSINVLQKFKTEELYTLEMDIPNDNLTLNDFIV